ncbi:MAG: DUF2269 family protein [Acidimicrobiales bacterium]
MILAATTDTGYKIVLVLHHLSVIIGAGAMFALPVVVVLMRKARDQSRADILAMVGATMKAVVAPALLLAGVFGGALVGFSDDLYDFSQTWLAIAGPLWIVLVALVWFVVAPAQLAVARLTRELATGDRDAIEGRIAAISSRIGMASGVTHLGLIVMLYLMAFRPGL